MPQLLLIALVALVGFLGYRAFVREARRVSAKVRREEREAQNKAIGTLIKDPKTGEYRPAREDD